MSIYSPPGNLIGFVFERCTIINSSLHLFDAMLPDIPLYEVSGPLITCSCFGSDVEFPIYAYGKSGENPVGNITKTWGGMLKELLTDSDTFGVSFPVDLEPKHKALFLATCLLIVSMIHNQDRCDKVLFSGLQILCSTNVKDGLFSQMRNVSKRERNKNDVKSRITHEVSLIKEATATISATRAGQLG